MAQKAALGSKPNQTCLPGRFARWSPGSTPRVSTAFLFFFLLTFQNTNSDEVRAARSETRSVGETTRRSYAGNVNATLRSAQVRADSAVVTSDSQRYWFHNNVRFEDDRYVVHADLLTYDAAGPTATLRGRVRLSEGDRSLVADRVTYSAADQTVVARGNVRVRMSDDQGTLIADRWFQDVSADSVSGVGQVRLIRARAETLRVEADEVQSAGSGGGLRFVSNVEFRQGGWRATSKSATLTGERDRITMAGDVRIDRVDASRDSFEAVGSQAVLTFEGDILSGATLMEEVSIRSVTLDTDTLTVSTVTADSSIFVFSGSEIASLDAFEDVTVDIRTTGVATSRLTGAHAMMQFEGDRPTKVRVPEQGEMRHAKMDQSLTADITGYGLAIDMAGTALRSVVVDSLAVCDLEGEHPTRLSGDRLNLAFRDGRLETAEVEGRVQGQYRAEGRR